jgi:hypothetical protein
MTGWRPYRKCGRAPVPDPGEWCELWPERRLRRLTEEYQRFQVIVVEGRAHRIWALLLSSLILVHPKDSYRQKTIALSKLEFLPGGNDLRAFLLGFTARWPPPANVQSSEQNEAL